jgi:exosortase/archaeosortase family protein
VHSLAVNLPGVYSRLSGRIGLPPAALHLLIWLSVAGVSSLALFRQIYAHIYYLMFNTEAQESAGAYPLAMLLFLVLWLGINSDSIRDRLRKDIDGFNLLPTALGVGLTVVAYVILLSSSLFDPTWVVFIELMILMIWFEGLALIFANATGLFALRYLALFIPTASLQYVLSTFLDAQVSFAFLSLFFPLLKFLGYPVILNTSVPSFQTITINRIDGPVQLWINSGCTGLPAISVFLLLAGLIYLDAKPKMKFFIPSVILGLTFTLLLNMFRLTVLVQQALAAPDVSTAYTTVASVHSWIGYAIYSVFYVVYVFIMLLPRFRQEQDSSNDVSSHADE